MVSLKTVPAPDAGATLNAHIRTMYANVNEKDPMVSTAGIPPLSAGAVIRRAAPSLVGEAPVTFTDRWEW